MTITTYDDLLQVVEEREGTRARWAMAGLMLDPPIVAPEDRAKLARIVGWLPRFMRPFVVAEIPTSSGGTRAVELRAFVEELRRRLDGSGGAGVGQVP